MLFSRGLKMLEVNLLSYSQAPPYFVDPPEGMKASLLDLIAYCARVSNPENQDNRETSKKLIKYLIKHKHWSPLEMVSACVQVTTTRDIARQALRHRSFSFQEYSQRYANPVKENNFEFVIREARLQDPKNRQNSTPSEDCELNANWRWHQEEAISAAKRAYNWAIKNGIAKEQARAVLPEGNTVTRFCMNGTLRSYIHYIELRSENGTQKEHMDMALAVGKVISSVFPYEDLI
jgi:thymidylate synthase (FAD)